MESTWLELISVCIAAASVGGGIGAKLHSWKVARRAAMPIVRAEWDVKGRLKVELVNRLNEDIFVESFRASGPLIETDARFDHRGGLVEASLVERAAFQRTNWRLRPGETIIRHFWIKWEDKRPRVVLVITSTDRTLRRRKIDLRHP